MHRVEKSLVNLPQLLRVIGLLLVFEGAFMLAPALTSLYYGETDWVVFTATAVITGGIGSLLMSKVSSGSGHMGKRDGFLLTALVWVIFSIFGMIPFVTCSAPIGFSDAFFESMSGFTTTGASVLVSTEGLSHGVMLWRAMMQWLGGMGIILFTLAVVPMLNHSGGMQMFNAEVTGITHDKIRPRISQTAKGLWSIYLTLTLVLVGLLWLGPMDLFDSVCHAFGAISTGGFTTDPALIASRDAVYVKLVLTAFMFLGGVSFALMFRCATGNFRDLRRSDVFRTYVGAIAVFFLLFVADALARGIVAGWQDVTVDPLFQVVSTITSTGYTTGAYFSPGAFVMALMVVMMFSGACAGSTSGGAKIDRLLFLFKNCRNEIFRCIHPNAVMPVRINGRVISPELVNKVIVFFCLYMMLIVAGGTVLCAIGVPLADAFFSAFSCVSNTGFGADITGYGGSYLFLPSAAKWVLALLMLVGRLEIFTVLVLLTPAFWKK